MIENRRVGIKSRELYEVPGALAIILAHRALEDLTLEREVAHHKPLVEQRWTDLVYDGQWFSPLRAALDAYVDATQTHVTGDVRLRFEPARARSWVVARDTRSTTSRSRRTAAATRSTSRTPGLRPLYGLPLKVWSAKQGAPMTEGIRRAAGAAGSPRSRARGACAGPARSSSTFGSLDDVEAAIAHVRGFGRRLLTEEDGGVCRRRSTGPRRDPRGSVRVRSRRRGRALGDRARGHGSARRPGREAACRPEERPGGDRPPALPPAGRRR